MDAGGGISVFGGLSGRAADRVGGKSGNANPAMPTKADRALIAHPNAGMARGNWEKGKCERRKMPKKAPARKNWSKRLMLPTC